MFTPSPQTINFFGQRFPNDQNQDIRTLVIKECDNFIEHYLGERGDNLEEELQNYDYCLKSITAYVESKKISDCDMVNQSTFCLYFGFGGSIIDELKELYAR